MSLGVIAREANPERTKSIFIMLQLLLGALLTMVLTSMLAIQGPGIVRLSLIGPSLLAMLAVSPARMLHGRNRTGRVFW